MYLSMLQFFLFHLDFPAGFLPCLSKLARKLKSSRKQTSIFRRQSRMNESDKLSSNQSLPTLRKFLSSSKRKRITSYLDATLTLWMSTPYYLPVPNDSIMCHLIQLGAYTFLLLLQHEYHQTQILCSTKLSSLSVNGICWCVCPCVCLRHTLSMQPRLAQTA